jgi:ParB/RepB/Spo0J family partition protein
VRSVRTEARIAALAQSLAEDGQKEPITVYLGNDGKYLILSGVTRYLAAQSLGWETLDVRVVTLGFADSPLAVVKASRLHNDTQRETELDHAFLAEKLRQAEHKPAEIAAALGYGSARGVTRLKAFFDLPISILELGKTKPEKFSASFAELLKKAADEEKSIGEERARMLLARCFAENLSLRELERLIRAEEKILQRDAKQRPWQTHAFDLRMEGSRVGGLNVWETPEQKQKILFSVLLDKAVGERLNTQLMAFFNHFMEEEAGNED